MWPRKKCGLQFRCRMLRPFIEKLVSGSGIDGQTTIAVVIGLFSANVVTLERAAELANRSVSDFIDILNILDIAWMVCTDEQKSQDDKAIQKLENKRAIVAEVDDIDDILESAGTLSPEPRERIAGGGKAGTRGIGLVIEFRKMR